MAQQNHANQRISSQLEEMYHSIHHESPQQSTNVEVQTDPTPQRITVRERLARIAQLRDEERVANIQTQQARAAVLNSQRQYFDSQSRYYEVAAESHRLYNENVRLRNEHLFHNRGILRARDIYILKVLLNSL